MKFFQEASEMIISFTIITTDARKLPYFCKPDS